MKEFIDSVEPKIEKLPFQRWHPIVSLFKQAPDKIYFMTAMKKGGIDINGENITPIDFFSSCSDLSDQEIIDSIEAYLSIEKLEDKIEEINRSLENSKIYIEEYLHMSLPKEIQNLEKLKNTDDALKIFKKTAVSKNGKNIGLSPAYCAMVSVLAAAFEFDKKEMRGLVNESAALYENMFSGKDSAIRNFHKIENIKQGYDKSAVFDELSGKIFIVDSYFRGKNENSFITKFISKPETTSEEVAKDGIGFKFEVKSTHDAAGLVPFLARYFKEKFAADNFIFENTNFFDHNAIKEIETAVKKNRNDFLTQNDFNKHANPNFECFKINGSLSTRKDGDVQGMKIRRRFEIQIVLSNNMNESGFSNHFIYEGSKKLFAATRLFGSFTERYLDLICDEASAGSGISAKKIKNYFKNNFIVEVKAKGYDKKRYANKHCARRFINSGIFSGDMEIKKI